MSRRQILKQFFFKSVVPISTALLLFFIFKSACTQDGQVDYLRLWILCGLPFGIHRMSFWIIPGGSMASFISQGLAVLVFGGVIGGFVLIWRVVIGIDNISVLLRRVITWKIWTIASRSKINCIRHRFKKFHDQRPEEYCSCKS